MIRTRLAGLAAVCRVVACILCVLAAVQTRLEAHVGSPDVFLDADAGPYHLLVTVRPPYAIPGVASVEILAPAGDVARIEIVPLPLSGPGARLAPVADTATRSADDPRLFTGHLWMMSAGAWQVRVTASGPHGAGMLSVPVPTFPQATLKMDRSLGVLLAALILLLAGGFVAIVSTTAREAALPIGVEPERAGRRRGRLAGAVAAAVMFTALALGDWWWTVEARRYDGYVYKPLQMQASTDDGRLRLQLRDPGWIGSRRVDDFIPDHNHRMHLFIVSPSLDRFWHLHPDVTDSGGFQQALPQIQTGRYELFADLVHDTGISETARASVELANATGRALEGDDSFWAGPEQVSADVAPLQDGGRIVWVRGPQALATRQLTLFTFRVEDASGHPASDLELYMGMPGHAVFVRRDLRVFAHVHPSGSAPMAAVAIGQRSIGPSLDGAGPTVDHRHQAGALSATITFPYGIPEPGEYRVFVQVKRSGRVQTAAFDAQVGP
jgi:hypothetical protein